MLLTQPLAAAPSRVALVLATGAGVGLLPRAPGSFGAALSIPIFLAVLPLPGWLLLVSLAGLFGLGVWAAEQAGRFYGAPDDPRIVIDEVFGQLLALAPLWFTAATPLALVTGFVLFRCLDIAKPGPVGWAERNFDGGMGVMLDDAVAGAIAAAVLFGLGLTGLFDALGACA